MTQSLVAIPFSQELQQEVQDFYCGNESWEHEVADWIKGSDVLYRMGEGTEVWLYATEGGDLVGYGSLVGAVWQYPLSDSPRKQISLIPNVAIQQSYWGRPEGPAEYRYSHQILADLIAKATKHTEREPLLGLFVHPQNARALHFYERLGFQQFHRTFKDQDTGVRYRSLLLSLVS